MMLLNALWSLAFVGCTSVAISPPNVILIIMDQYRHDVMGSWGNSAALTPNIDSIAQDGILFKNAYTSTPSCTPARAAILTGRSPWGHGMLGYGAISMNYSFEMIHTLNENGYYTSVVGKNHFGWYNATSPVLHGYKYHKIYDGGGNGFPNTTAFGYDDYDKWFQTVLPGKNPLATGLPYMDWNSWRGAPYVYDEYYHPTQWVTRESMTFIESYFNQTNNSKNSGKNSGKNSNNSNNTKPLFMKISYHRPHSPYDPPERFLNDSLKTDIPYFVSSKDNWDVNYKVETKYCNQNQPDAWCGKFSDNITHISRAAYYANVEFIDSNIGELLNLLKNLNIYNNTFIILTADHGDMLGDHYLWRKTYPYESSSHIPMLIKWPNIENKYFDSSKIATERGSIDNINVVELRDILPTVLNASQIDIKNVTNVEIEGMNMLCLLYYNDSNSNNSSISNKECNWREYVDLEHNICYNTTNHWNALTDGKWKYIFNAFYPREQLFNLVNDPYEEYDLALIANKNETINQTLGMWRQRMVTQFENEQRGNDWVKNGTLQQRIQGQPYGPNFPGHTPPRQEFEAFELSAFVQG